MEKFIQENDYDTIIRDHIRNILIQNDDDILHDAELIAQEEIESYLRARFDVGQIFSLDQELKDRKKIIVMYMIDIALYHLHANISPENVPEIRYLRYTRAIEWLKKVAEGKLQPDFPLKPVTDEPFELGGANFFHGGSNEKYTERF